MHQAECQKTGIEQVTPGQHDGAEVTPAPDVAASSTETMDAVQYAGFWRRLAAYIIDIAVVLLIGFALSIVVPILLAPLVGLPSDLWIIVSLVLFWLIVPWLYWALMESSSRQATLGKSYLDIMVTDANGHRLTFAKATARYWAKVPSRLILYAGYFMAGFTPKKQALHDILTGCLVIIKK